MCVGSLVVWARCEKKKKIGPTRMLPAAPILRNLPAVFRLLCTTQTELCVGGCDPTHEKVGGTSPPMYDQPGARYSRTQ